MIKEEINRQNIFDLVRDRFSLSPESLKRFEKELYEPILDPFYAELLKEYKSEDLRIRFPIFSNQAPSMDKGWALFQKTFSNFCLEKRIHYRNFLENKFPEGKNYLKMKKALTLFYLKKENHNFLLEDIGPIKKEAFEKALTKLIEEVGAKKMPNKELEIVLSFNFADWFLCSTGQSWGSCLDLNSTYENSYWAGLPGFIVDNNRAMLYITEKGKKKTCYGITTDSFISRSWILLDMNSVMNVVKMYPNSYLELSTINDKTNLYFKFLDSDFESKNSIDFLYYTNEKSVYIYQDETYLEDNKKLYYGDGGFCYFDGSVNYEDIFYYGSLEDLLGSHEEIADHFIDACVCSECGDATNEPFTFEGEDLCSECYNNLVTTCDSCGSEIWRDDSIDVDDYSTVCNNCYQEYYFTCDECEQIFPIENATIGNGRTICEGCIEDLGLQQCSKCKDFFDEGELVEIEYSDGLICNQCLREAIDKKQMKFNFSKELVPA